MRDGAVEELGKIHAVTLNRDGLCGGVQQITLGGNNLLYGVGARFQGNGLGLTVGISCVVGNQAASRVHNLIHSARDSLAIRSVHSLHLDGGLGRVVEPHVGRSASIQDDTSLSGCGQDIPLGNGILGNHVRTRGQLLEDCHAGSISQLGGQCLPSDNVIEDVGNVSHGVAVYVVGVNHNSGLSLVGESGSGGLVVLHSDGLHGGCRHIAGGSELLMNGILTRIQDLRDGGTRTVSGHDVLNDALTITDDKGSARQKILCIAIQLVDDDGGVTAGVKSRDSAGGGCNLNCLLEGLNRVAIGSRHILYAVDAGFQVCEGECAVITNSTITDCNTIAVVQAHAAAGNRRSSAADVALNKHKGTVAMGEGQGASSASLNIDGFAGSFNNIAIGGPQLLDREVSGIQTCDLEGAGRISGVFADQSAVHLAHLKSAAADGRSVVGGADSLDDQGSKGGGGKTEVAVTAVGKGDRHGSVVHDIALARLSRHSVVAVLDAIKGYITVRIGQSGPSNDISGGVIQSKGAAFQILASDGITNIDGDITRLDIAQRDNGVFCTVADGHRSVLELIHIARRYCQLLDNIGARFNVSHESKAGGVGNQVAIHSAAGKCASGNPE